MSDFRWLMIFVWTLGSSFLLLACESDPDQPEPDADLILDVFEDVDDLQPDVADTMSDGGEVDVFGEDVEGTDIILPDDDVIAGPPSQPDVLDMPDIFDPDPEPLPELGRCPEPVNVWANRNRFAFAAGPHQAWPIPETTTLCGETWIAILERGGAQRNVWNRLAREYIAARLNVAAGAPVPPAIERAIQDARRLVTTCESFIVPGDPRRERAIQLANLLAAYNSHQFDVGICLL